MTGLEELRGELDVLDEQIIRSLGRRLGICREIARYKKAHGIPMMQPHRVEAVRHRYEERGVGFGLSRAFARGLADLILVESCRQEDEIIGPAAALLCQP